MSAAPTPAVPDARPAEVASVTTHLVVLAERLDALAPVQGTPGDGPVRVLFVSSHNAGRSQLAAALLQHRADGRVAVSSAGTHSGPGIEPHIAQVLTEAGADTAEQFPTPLTDEIVKAVDIVITMGCGDACPAVPGRRYLDWSVADPDGAPIEAVCAIRDDNDLRIAELLAGLPST
ncbi:arsenate-mycothiol transferase ArsC [Streptomyces niveiscabiei]|uniref:Low molecular weight phosphatase family protein n=1 Tax=Streptomyces niveiscabiei TaxID=164115 RepID=A0ABW9HKB1_9ACTN